MEAAVLRLRFRNEIRCRELNEYKQRIRESFFSEGTLPSFAEQVYITPNQAEIHTFDPQFQKMQMLIREFQCSEGDVVGWECEEESASRSWEEGKMGFATLQDLQLFAAEWFRGKYLCCCIQLVPRIFFQIMETHMPQLRQGETRMKRRLRKVWRVCQREMMAQLARRQREGILEEEEKACLTSMVAYKLFFLQKYALLEDRDILDINLPYFTFIFHEQSGFRQEAPYERIVAAFLFPCPRDSLPTDAATFTAFIDICLEWLHAYAITLSNNYTVQFLDCCIGLIQMVIKLALIQGGYQVQEILMKAVILGAALCKGLQGVCSEMREALLLSLLFVANRGRLQEWSHLQKEIVTICWQSFLIPQQEVLYLWAIETLGRARAITALQKLQIHLTYKRCSAFKSEQLQHYELCMILLCKAMASLQ